MAWLVYRVSGSAALLGVTAFVTLIPQLVVAPLAGAWGDRYDRLRSLLVVEVLLCLQALALALVSALGHPTAPLLVGLAALLGLLNSFEGPLRQSLMTRLVPGGADLSNAIALNAMLFNIGRLLAPPLAGLMLMVMNEAACFAVNAASFLAIIAGLLALRVERQPASAHRLGHVFREGLRYLAGTPALRRVVTVLVFENLTASSYAVLLPVFAREIFAGDARTLGLLWGAAGGGALMATLSLASHRSLERTMVWIFIGLGLSVAALLLLPLAHAVAPAMVAMMLLGFGISSTNVGCNITLQTACPDAMRGRMVSIFGSVRWGFDALGGLAAGFAASRVGAQRAVLGEALVLGLAGLWLATHRRQMRRELAVASGAPQA